MGKFATHPRLSDGRRLLDFLRGGRKVGAISAPRLVAGRDGRPDAGFGVDPRGDDGRGGRLHAGACWIFDPGIGASVEVIAWIGSITALIAALIATQQNDIKRMLAYSTLSQLGYMVMAVGFASGQAAMFHLFTHAAFKALLFLGSGSIIFMLHHEQNIWQMGGLAKRLPITFLTFLVGTLALIGCPGFSGFFSKDAILVARLRKAVCRFFFSVLSQRCSPRSI